MRFRLTNQNNPKKTLCVSTEAWTGLLALAEEHGWNPLGTGLPWWWDDSERNLDGQHLCELDNWNGDYTAGDGGLVLLEDALNLADALEKAFIESEPEPARSPDGSSPGSPAGPDGIPGLGIGTLTALVDFCREGPFWIERS